MTRKFSLVLTLATVGFLWAEIGSAEEGIVKNSIAPTAESIKLGTIFSLSGWGSEGAPPSSWVCNSP